jgi:outer membrane protein insertion porin family
MKRLLILLFLALAAVAAFAQADEGWFWGKPIAAVQWEGVNHADRRELDTATKPYIGKEFTEQLWLELQAKLYELDWFEKIEPAALAADPEKTKVVIKFVVVEKPSIEAIRIAGNSGLRTNEILDAITEKAGDIFNQSKARIDELAVRRLYLEKGYPDASISSSSLEGKAPGTVVLSFAIVEGAQVALKEIRFGGNSAVSAQTLKGQIGLKEAGLFQSGAFQESKLEEDKRAIVEYYRSRGFVDAAVSDVVRSYEKDPKSGRTWLVLTVVIAEGHQWTYGGLVFEGNQIFSKEKLAALVNQKPGSVLNFKKLQQDKQRIDDLYYESGYIFNSIELVESRDEEKGSISYVIKIKELDRAHIESIAFKGNVKTKDYVLYRELPLEVGDIFSKAKIIEGLRNLYNLQYFSAVEPEMFPGSAESLMNLVINVEEQSTADVNFGVTLSGLGDPDTFPLSGLIKWNDRNFFGNGQDFAVELNASPTDQTLTFSFQDKWLFGKRFSGGVDLAFAHKTKTTGQDSIGPIFEDGVPDPFTTPIEDGYSLSDIPSAYLMPYTYWDFSLGFSTGRTARSPIGDLGMGGGYTIGLGMKTYDADKYRPASKDLRDSRGEWQLGNKILIRAYVNDLDLWYNPGKGYYASQRLTWTGLFPFEPQQYLKSDTRLDAYMTLFDIPVFEGWNLKWILGGHTGFSALLKKPFSDGLVVTDDWLGIDGTFTARGWSNLLGKEGIALWDNWVELRMPIVESFLWIDGFFDAAALQTESGLLDMTATTIAGDPSRPTFGQLGWDSMAFSIGFGFRFAISQFPFRFYFDKRFTFDGSKVTWKTAGSGFVISITQPLY